MNITPSIETQPAAVIKQFQETKLTVALAYLSDHSAFYQRMFHEHRIDIKKIRTLEDLTTIPFTDKSDLQTYNKDFICVPQHKIVDYITTSGTLGDPVTFAMTDADLDRLAYNEQISFQCAGAKPGDIFQLMTTIDKRFMAGTGVFPRYTQTGSRYRSCRERYPRTAMGHDPTDLP